MSGNAAMRTRGQRARQAVPRLLIATIAVMGNGVMAAEPEVDGNTGLVRAPGWEMAAAHCGGCHSYALVTAQRGDADFWRSTIRCLHSMAQVKSTRTPKTPTAPKGGDSPCSASRWQRGACKTSSETSTLFICTTGRQPFC